MPESKASSLEPMPQSALIKLLQRGLLVRAKLNLTTHFRIHQVQIETLSPGWNSSLATHLIYASTRPRIRHRYRTTIQELSVQSCSPFDGQSAYNFYERWHAISDFWGRSKDAVAVVQPLDVNSHPISPADPRLLGEYLRMQLLLDMRLNSYRGSNPDLVRAYNLLGRFIEAQHHAWSTVII